MLERTLDRMRVSLEDPLVLVRLAAGFLLAFGTIVAVAFWLAADDTRFLKLVLGLWGVYGFTVGVVDGLLTPLIEGASRALQGFGVRRSPDYSSIEALVAGGHYALAAEEYRQRAEEPRERVAATMRRAALFAGPMGNPAGAALELTGLRTGGPLSRDEDLRVGLALMNLYEHQLAEPGRAMAELSRLVELYAGTRRGATLSRMLKARKRIQFGDSPTT
ncbi:MAG: hypothetical protein H6Q77_155 [Gemmatimonadetes bacterium]|jgi:hypothetical protein|nr:hypothetical protein [Gemmatimonadota bacterium]